MIAEAIYNQLEQQFGLARPAPKATAAELAAYEDRACVLIARERADIAAIEAESAQLRAESAATRARIAELDVEIAEQHRESAKYRAATEVHLAAELIGAAYRAGKLRSVGEQPDPLEANLRRALQDGGLAALEAELREICGCDIVAHRVRT